MPQSHVTPMGAAQQGEPPLVIISQGPEVLSDVRNVIRSEPLVMILISKPIFSVEKTYAAATHCLT